MNDYPVSHCSPGRCPYAIYRERKGRVNLGMVIGHEFILGFGMTAEYTNGDLQLKNGCADLDVCKGTGP